jgi:hypothetical protein
MINAWLRMLFATSTASGMGVVCSCNMLTCILSTVSMSTLPAAPGASLDEGPGQNKLFFEQLQRLPLPAQLQLEMLEALVMLADVSGSEMVLPR